MKWILRLEDFSGRFSQWLLHLKGFDFEVIRRAGIFHQAVNSLSRLPTDAADKPEMEEDFQTLYDDEKSPRVSIACFQFDECEGAEIEDSEILTTETAVEESKNYNGEIISP